jgi:hypothetical protein
MKLKYRLQFIEMYCKMNRLTLSFVLVAFCDVLTFHRTFVCLIVLKFSLLINFHILLNIELLGSYGDWGR